MISPKICLGTAQFGLDYGITNQTGKVEIEEIIKIIEIAQKENISLIDTAQGYGDCEYILGKCIKKPNNFKIVSKLPSQNKNFFTKEDQIQWENNLNYSLNKLKVNQLEALLLHNSNDLKRECLIYIEFPFNKKDAKPFDSPENWKLLKENKSGEVSYLLFKNNAL